MHPGMMGQMNMPSGRMHPQMMQRGIQTPGMQTPGMQNPSMQFQTPGMLTPGMQFQSPGMKMPGNQNQASMMQNMYRPSPVQNPQRQGGNQNPYLNFGTNNPQLGSNGINSTVNHVSTLSKTPEIPTSEESALIDNDLMVVDEKSAESPDASMSECMITIINTKKKM